MGLGLLCLTQKPLPCSKAWRGLCSRGGGTQRRPLAQLKVYTPQGSPRARTDVLLVVPAWSREALLPDARGSLQERQPLWGPRRLARVQDPHWAISSRTMAVRFESRDILSPGLGVSILSSFKVENVKADAISGVLCSLFLMSSLLCPSTAFFIFLFICFLSLSSAFGWCSACVVAKAARSPLRCQRIQTESERDTASSSF